LKLGSRSNRICFVGYEILDVERASVIVNWRYGYRSILCSS